ncbi:zinc finger matrin-type protein 5 isoform X6 [Rhineura floridana]|uniref:zinc finger matrin-type protein 5 isoform X6 n=1 Tax=Rhineura floridana TaxID=261503 RepID=UPI002AC85750|nr:zinc finger matrin-type protein 5 isoform X6 [Rhineura floridana]
MGKRYFCDYCERSFQDTLHNRKKHLNGVQHLRAKKGWYDVFRDAAAILQEEQNKKPCRKFLQTGQCDFGANCRFSHLTEEGLEKLNAQRRGERKNSNWTRRLFRWATSTSGWRREPSELGRLRPTAPSRRKNQFSSILPAGHPSRSFRPPCRPRLLLDGRSRPLSSGDDC